MDDPINAMSQSPAQREAAKTRAERAQDVAYTLNHSISCGTTDMFIAPSISALFGVQVGCSDPTHDHTAHAHEQHDHGAHGQAHHDAHGHVPHSHVHAPSIKKLGWETISWKMYRAEAWHYLRGEIIGDLAAVPLTILVQRSAPALMDGIRRLVEPIAAPFFHRGANEAARKWGESQGLAADAPEIVARAEAMYRTEIRHLPQVVMWNLFAFPIGAITQKMGGHGSSYARIIRNKAIGGVISNGILLSARTLAPNIAQQWDAANGNYIIAPTAGVLGKVLGLRDEDFAPTDALSWTKRMEASRQPDAAEITVSK